MRCRKCERELGGCSICGRVGCVYPVCEACHTPAIHDPMEIAVRWLEYGIKTSAHPTAVGGCT